MHSSCTSLLHSLMIWYTVFSSLSLSLSIYLSIFSFFWSLLFFLSFFLSSFLSFFLELCLLFHCIFIFFIRFHFVEFLFLNFVLIKIFYISFYSISSVWVVLVHIYLSFFLSFFLSFHWTVHNRAWSVSILLPLPLWTPYRLLFLPFFTGKPFSAFSMLFNSFSFPHSSLLVDLSPALLLTQPDLCWQTSRETRHMHNMPMFSHQTKRQVDNSHTNGGKEKKMAATTANGRIRSCPNETMA